VYSDIESSVLRVRSEEIYFAVNLRSGVMEYWNAGILGLAEFDLLFIDGTEQKIKSDHHPLLILNIPFFSPIRRLYEPEATIPLFHGFSDDQHHSSGVKSSPATAWLLE
jgi:hypothetical protein